MRVGRTFSLSSLAFFRFMSPADSLYIYVYIHINRYRHRSAYKYICTWGVHSLGRRWPSFASWARRTAWARACQIGRRQWWVRRACRGRGAAPRRLKRERRAGRRSSVKQKTRSDTLLLEVCGSKGISCKKRNRSHTQTHNKNNTTHDTTRTEGRRLKRERRAGRRSSAAE